MADNIDHRKARSLPPRRNPETDLNSIVSKKKNFTSATLRGLGCASSSQVSLPAAIRTSATWEHKKKSRAKRLSTKKINYKLPVDGSNPTSQPSLTLASSCSSSSDVCFGPVLNDVNCVVSTRPARAELDTIILARREHSYTVRRMVIPQDNPFVESDAGLGMARMRSDMPGSRHHRHLSRHGLHEGLAEIVMLQSNLVMGGRPNRLDRYRDLRLDVDNMSYEELLELGDRIGHVNTGLKEDEITHCLRWTKLATLEDLSTPFPSQNERKCSICQDLASSSSDLQSTGRGSRRRNSDSQSIQESEEYSEEYKRDDEAGILNCGHSYHMYCIKQWLGQKNSCPICKAAALTQT